MTENTNVYVGAPCPKGHTKRYRMTGRCVICRTKSVKRVRVPKTPMAERIEAGRESVTARLEAALRAIGEEPVGKIDRVDICVLCLTEDMGSFDHLCLDCCERSVSAKLDPRVRAANWVALPPRVRAALLERARRAG